jgi:hypothetical protein
MQAEQTKHGFNTSCFLLTWPGPQDECRNDKNMADHYYAMAYKSDPSNGDVLQAYANFLRSVKKDYAKALLVYGQVPFAACSACPKPCSQLLSEAWRPCLGMLF